MVSLRQRRSIALAIGSCLLLVACSADDSASTRDGTGGDRGTGGAMGTGGVTAGGSSTGGTAPGTGGSRESGSGGSPGSGGDADAGSGGASSGGAGAVGASGGSSGGQGGRPASGGGHPGAAGGDGRAGAPGSNGGRGGSAGAAGRTGAGGREGAGGRSGVGGAGGLGPNAPGGRVTGYGTVLISARSSNQIVRLQTSMVVPPTPPASGTLFLWPGLQPNGANFDPIDNGVLQPVLTWGPSCAPGKQPRAYSTWWISGQYVNTFGKEPGYTDCHGGPIMSVDVGDVLNIDMALAGTIWTQTVTDAQTGESVAYSLDMMNQSQNLAYFVIEEYSSAPVSDVVFADIVITFGSADSADCKLTMRGQNDFVAAPVPSSDGRSCTIQQIILRAQGVP